MNKKFKIILSALIIALLAGYVALYQWAKNRFQETHQELTQQMQAEGWAIDQSPLVFSGFPFKIVATQEKFKAVHQDGHFHIQAMEPQKMHVSIFNPLKYTFEGTDVFSFGTPNPKLTITFKMGSIKLQHRDNKLEPISFESKNTKLEILPPEGHPALTIQIGFLSFGKNAYKISGDADSKILQAGATYTLKDLEAAHVQNETKTPAFHLQKVKITTTAKGPLGVMEQLKDLLKGGAHPAISKICQTGGKVPPLKSTMDQLEKTGSQAKINAEVEHKDYILHLDLDAQVKKSLPDLLLVIQVNNVSKFFDALGLDPTLRFIVGNFIKKESDKSEKARVTLKLTDNKLSLNELDLMKWSAPDWDNIVLPADLCSKYVTSTTATK